MEKYYWFCFLVSVNALLLVILAAYVSVLRVRYKISYGEKDNKHLLKAVRTHANGVEQVPIFALLVLALTYTNNSNFILACLVLIFTFSRISHAIGMLFRVHIARKIGAGITYLLQIITSVLLFFSLFS